MASRNCIICGYYTSRPFCPSCEDTANKHFETICEYVKDHSRPTVIEVYAETGVPLPVIYGLKDLGWVDIVPNDGGELIITPRAEKFLSKFFG